MKFLPILIAAGVAAGLSTLPVRPVFVTGRSMEPSLHNFQFALGSRDVKDLRRGDVVVADTPEGTSVKRVAFVEGDTVAQYLWLGEWMTPETKQMQNTMERTHLPKRELRIKAGEVFLVGDNLNCSIDSRAYGAVPISHVRLRIENVPNINYRVSGAQYVNNPDDPNAV